MLRRFLLGLALFLLSFTVTTRIREAREARAVAAVPPRRPPPTARPELTASSQGARAPLPAGPVAPLDSMTRLTARLRLSAEPERHYLDSLFTETDSIIRRWSLASGMLPVSIVDGGADGFRPDMVADARWAIDTWSPAMVGVQLHEVPDSAEARLIIRWSDTLGPDRAGLTDVIWDRAGRIHRAVVWLGTRSPATGRPLAPAVRRAVALHELGHALGLPHSARPEDVMHPVATQTVPSGRDRFSLRLLYSLPTGWVGVEAAGPRR